MFCKTLVINFWNTSCYREIWRRFQIRNHYWTIPLNYSVVRGFLLRDGFTWRFQTKRVTGLLELVQFYKQDPLEKFVIFTIYQNYFTWSVTKELFNKRVRNLAVSKEPWDISEVIRDKHGINKNIPGLGRKRSILLARPQQLRFVYPEWPLTDACANEIPNSLI